MSGTLTIYSTGDGSILSGHSWISYQPDHGELTTYGTWGNNPENLGNGLHTNLEKGHTADAQRSMHLNDDQEKALYAKIEEYKDKGEDGWSPLSPCSAFASDTWQTATGEKLQDRSFGVVSNPSRLKGSIDSANNETSGDMRVGQTSVQRSGSIRKIRSATEPCSGGSW